MQWQTGGDAPAPEERPQPSDIGIIVWIASKFFDLPELIQLRTTSRLHMFSVKPRLGDDLRQLKRQLHQLNVLLHGVERAVEMARAMPRPRPRPREIADSGSPRLQDRPGSS